MALLTQVGHLRDILALSSLLPNVNKMLDKIVQQAVNTAGPLEDFRRTPYNASFALGLCLKSFSGQGRSSKPNIAPFDLTEITQRWGWSETVMEALASLSASRYVVVAALISIPFLTSFELRVSEVSDFGGCPFKPETIFIVPLAIITAKHSAHLFFSPCKEIGRRKRGH